jgi:hypothetical protein
LTPPKVVDLCDFRRICRSFISNQQSQRIFDRGQRCRFGQNGVFAPQFVAALSLNETPAARQGPLTSSACRPLSNMSQCSKLRYFR